MSPFRPFLAVGPFFYILYFQVAHRLLIVKCGFPLSVGEKQKNMFVRLFSICVLFHFLLEKYKKLGENNEFWSWLPQKRLSFSFSNKTLPVYLSEYKVNETINNSWCDFIINSRIKYVLQDMHLIENTEGK